MESVNGRKPEHTGGFVAMKQRTLDALRALADRPGTEAEGVVAREILARQTGSSASQDDIDDIANLESIIWKKFRDSSADRATDDFIEMLREYFKKRPSFTTCECGTQLSLGGLCQNFLRHDAIRMEIRARFKPDDEVFYNRWAYAVNSPGRVVGYPRPARDNWNWLRIQFDHVSQPRAVPVYCAKGWNLSVEPLDEIMAQNLRSPFPPRPQSRT